MVYRTVAVVNNGFNPRARMGRDLQTKRLTVMRLVSIHAPAWGATLDKVKIEDALQVSIHAPAWGATASVAVIQRVDDCFNPRARMGRDC